MTRYVRLYNNDGIDINIVFGTDVGGWIQGVNKKNYALGKELVREVQTKLRHDRIRMANPMKWKDPISNLADKYNLQISESVVTDEQEGNEG